MKKIKFNKKKALKIGGSIFVYTLLFGIGTATAIKLIPATPNTTVIINNGKATPEESRAKVFVEHMIGQATGNGLALDFDTLEAYIPGKDANDVTTGNKLDAAGAALRFSLEGISLHQANLSLHAPVNYNGKNRELDLALIHDELYFKIQDNDADSWDFKYKVSVGASDDLDGEGNQKIDPITNGILQYEYGDLDWIIEDILGILTDGGFDLSLPSLSLGGEESSSSSNEEGESSDIINDIMSSLENLTEYEGYFVWSLPLGGQTYDIGLSCDENLYLSGIDFPAKTGVDHDQQEAFEIRDNGVLKAAIKVSASLNRDIDSLNWDSLVPADANSYLNLRNSAGLLEKIARYAVNPKIGITTVHGDNDEDGLLLTHYKKASVDNGGPLNEEDIIEKATLSLDGNIDLEGGSLNAFGADVRFSSKNATTSISAIYDSEKTAYVNLDNLLKAKMSKSTFDALYAKIMDLIESTSQGQDSALQSEGITEMLDEVLPEMNEPSVIEGLKAGHYEGVLDFIKSIHTEDNLIEVTLTLAPLSLEGEISVILDGTYDVHGIDTYLSGIRFSGLKLASFQLDGIIRLAAFQTPEVSGEEAAQYGELDHLIGLAEQIEDIAGSKAGELTLSGSIALDGQDDIGQDKAVNFNAPIAFDLNKKVMGAKVNVEQISTHYSQDHHFSLHLNSDDDLNEELNAVYFSYDSRNADFLADDLSDPYTGKDSLGKARTQPKKEAFKGYMPFSSISDIVSLIKNMIPQEESAETSSFEAFAGAVAQVAGENLGGNLIDHEFFSLLDTKILKSASLLGDVHTFVLDGSVFGLGKDLEIALAYDANVTAEDGSKTYGGLDSLTLSYGESHVSLSLDATSLNDQSKVYVFGDMAHINLTDFTDFSSLYDLADYGIGTLDLGKTSSNTYSTYALEGAVKLNLAGYEMKPFTVSLYLKANSNNIHAHLKLHGIPLIKGLNAPDSSIYFRAHEAEGYRDVDIYYHGGSDAVDGGDLYITRDSSYGKVRAVKDSLRLSGNEFIGSAPEGTTYSYNALGWLLTYVLGVDQNNFVSQVNENANSESSSSSLALPDFLTKRAIHVEDVLSGYHFENASGSNPAWSMGFDLGELIDEAAILGDLRINMEGLSLSDEAESATWKTLSDIDISVAMDLGGKLRVCSAGVSLSLLNVQNGVYTDGFANNGYQQFFLAEDGTDMAAANAFGAFVTYDGSDLPGNHYLGIN